MGKTMTVGEMLGGKTSGPDYEAAARRLFGFRVRIVRLSSVEDGDEREYEGLAGKLAAPFANFQGPLGLYLAPGQDYVQGYDGKPAKTGAGCRDTINLLAGDTVELLDGELPL